MRNFRPTLLAGALALALTAGTASAQFTNTYIFGDSLSDAGVFGARFTTNPGLTAPMYVGQNWGITSTPFTVRRRRGRSRVAGSCAPGAQHSAAR